MSDTIVERFAWRVGSHTSSLRPAGTSPPNFEIQRKHDKEDIDTQITQIAKRLKFLRNASQVTMPQDVTSSVSTALRPRRVVPPLSSAVKCIKIRKEKE